ncbi:phosphotransferase system glucitol/sorbitol-specific iia component [Trichococcus palustris]|jgi:glucitol/sorbitol PTS system EIIA component|uniref:Phosphotransferase system glucitol/sorbitol-specific iia component n=1 Tax=Trichococcus palustris TaxID=140314 RepID=A0A143Y4B0_9LACT|nr:PTS glucitol/sorbitol transporter subunit IIA [Trichococcus palustris]CZQ81324.1 phosphotransferase system glucitol/sorbitol-specific iia component [Trichococcus palustris]SFK62852.1 PTS system, glucitol/sorbitol-specific IIA component [Trichococcus palustris]
MQSTVIQIGKDAIDKADPVVILFGETATEALQNVSVIQRFQQTDRWTDLRRGDAVFFDEQEYTIAFIGSSVHENLRSLGHTTFMFKSEGEEPLETSIYSAPYTRPAIMDGTTIMYKTKVEGDL